MPNRPRTLGLCLLASVAIHGVLLLLLARFWEPLTSIRLRQIPSSTPIVVTLLPKPIKVAKLPKPATPEAPHSTYAPKPHHAGGSESHRVRAPRPVHRIVPMPLPKQTHIAMAPKHVSIPAPSRPVPHPVIAHKVASNQAELPAQDRPTSPTPSTAPVDTTATTPAAPAMTGPSTPGGGTDSGSPKGSDEGSGTGDRGNGNGTGPGDSTGTGSGPGPFGIDAGPGEGPRHIVYVVDVSGSMDSRIDSTRQQLSDALSTLSPRESFNLIAFSNKTRVFDEGRLDPATQDNVSLAKRWLDYQQPNGGTALQDALMQALSMPDVNVVVVITDGVPTIGETNFGKIAKNIRRRNRNHARIYTVGQIGKNPDGTDDSFEAARLLTQLADDSGGTHKFVTLGVATP